MPFLSLAGYGGDETITFEKFAIVITIDMPICDNIGIGSLFAIFDLCSLNTNE